MDYATIWILFGKLPIILLFACTMYCCSKQIGFRLTTWSFSAFFVSLSIGVTLFPSILGAYIIGIISLFGVLKVLSKQAKAWQFIVWPLMNTFLFTIIIGRIGCWLAGCCFGEVSDLMWAIQYTDEGFISDYHLDRYHHFSQGHSLKVHPVQLYESLGLFIIFGLGLKLKSLWGELSAASFTFANYLIVYSLINPLKAFITTPASLIQIGPFSLLQLGFLSFATIMFCLAFLLKKHHSIPQPVRSHHSDEFVKKVSLTEASILWISISTCAGMSLSFGTPFSAQLGVIGVCLSAVAFIQTLHEGINRFEDDTDLLLDIPDEELFSHNIQIWAFFIAIIPLCLLPLATHTNASSHHESIERFPKTWVYRLDETSLKLVRVGRVADLSPDQIKAINEHQVNYTRARSCAGPNIYLRY